VTRRVASCRFVSFRLISSAALSFRFLVPPGSIPLAFSAGTNQSRQIGIVGKMHVADTGSPYVPYRYPWHIHCLAFVFVFVFVVVSGFLQHQIHVVVRRGETTPVTPARFQFHDNFVAFHVSQQRRQRRLWIADGLLLLLLLSLLLLLFCRSVVPIVAVVVVVVVAVAPAAVDVVATLAALLPLPLKLATQ